MRVALLLLAVLLAVHCLPAAAQGGPNTICGKYTAALFGNDSAANETALITAIVSRAALGGSGTGFMGYTVLGLFNSSGPLYPIFSGQVQYRSGAPNYTNTAGADFPVLAGHLVSYFGALFGCQVGTGQTGSIVAVHSSDMWGIHRNMGITASMETYFNTALATTLLSFGVSSTDVGTAGTVLSLFNRYGSPIQAATTQNTYISASPSGGLTQICGDPSCPLATNANSGYYLSSSSTGSGATHVQASIGLVAALLLVAGALSL